MLMSFYLCVYLQGSSIFSPKLCPRMWIQCQCHIFMFVYFLVCLQLHVSNKVGFRRSWCGANNHETLACFWPLYLHLWKTSSWLTEMHYLSSFCIISHLARSMPARMQGFIAECPPRKTRHLTTPLRSPRRPRRSMASFEDGGRVRRSPWQWAASEKKAKRSLSSRS